MDFFGLVSFFLIVGLVFLAAFFEWSSLVWSVAIGVGLFVTTVWGHFNDFLSILCWSFYLVAVAFSNLHTLRQKKIVAPMLNLLRHQMPVISRTEREALEAGNTWWEKALFCGRPDWRELFRIPKPALNASETAFLNNEVETLCQMLNDWQIVFNDKNLPEVVWDYLKKQKFFGMVIPKEYGGLGFSALAHSTVITKIATRSLSTAVNTMVPNSLGPGELLVHYGTDAQKNYYLPRLAKGEEIPCFALTAPEAGSDAGAIPDTGIVCKGMHEGREVIGIRLSWDKRYITLAPIATVLGLAFKLYDPNHLIGQTVDIGITLCLIPTSHPGVDIGTRHYPLQQAFLNGPTRGKDVFIPLDWIIGGPEMAGQGWRMLMECLSIGRAISLPALSTACSKAIYRFTGAYSRLRRQFNASLSAFEGIEEALGYIAGYTYTLEAARIMTAGAVDLKVKPSIASAIAKYHMTELSRVVIEHGMDVHAGHMIQMGPRNFLANMHIGIPISITVEGANILTRNLIIFGQGAIRCHPYLLKEVELITAAQPDIAALDRTLMSHVGYLVSNLLRTVAYGFTGGRFIRTTFKQKRIQQCERQLTRMSTALALLSDVSLILLGGSLKRRERLSARLGDIMSQLYLASATLKYYVDHEKPATDVDYVVWSVQASLWKIQTAIDELLHNFPYKRLGKLLRFMVFPWGSAYHAPKDTLHKKIVEVMLQPSDFRDRLTQYCFISKNADEFSQRIDTALDQYATVEPILKKMNQGLKKETGMTDYTSEAKITTAKDRGILTAEESQQLFEYEQLRQEVIKVNEFSFNLEEVIA